jgi:hypothetical protein
VRSGQAVPLAVLTYGQSGALFINPTNTDKQRSTITLGDYRNPASTAATRIYIRARSNFATYACAQIDDDVMRIATGAGFGTETVRASATMSRSAATGDSFTFEVSGNVFKLTYPGGTVSWTDSGGVVPTGTQCRYVGFGVNNTLADAYSAAINSWSGKDFT